MAGPQKRKAGFPPKGGADVTRRHPAMAVALNKHRRCRRACGCSYQPTKRSFEQTIELRPGTRKSNPFQGSCHFLPETRIAPESPLDGLGREKLCHIDSSIDGA